METRLFLGLDLGKRRDYTALVAGYRRLIRQGWDPVRMGYPLVPRLELMQAERYLLGTRYVDIAEDLAQRVREAESRGWGVRCAVDATGVGEGVVEILEEAGLRGKLWPVVVAGGQADAGKLRGKAGSSHHTVTKTQLFYGLRVAMEQGRTVLQKGMPGRELLLEELRHVEEVRTPMGRLTANGKASGHDDLAFAAALVQWAARQAYPSDVRRVRG